MAEYIEKQAAIDALMEILDRPNHAEFLYTDEICKALSAIPSAQPEQRWIPVSEKLPEDKYVLISKKPTKLSGSKFCVGIGIRIADPRSGEIQWRDSGFRVIQDDKVLAWRPLPEAYQEDKA